MENGAVRYALGALKGVGEKAMEALVEERERGGPFTNVEDFAAQGENRLIEFRQCLVVSFQIIVGDAEIEVTLGHTRL